MPETTGKNTMHNIISVSGGKDSTALLLLAIERGVENLQAVFADTGHEHQQTYDYVRYLEQITGVPIKWVRADFTKDIERKRAFVLEKWKPMLMAGAAGRWEFTGEVEDSCSSVDVGEEPPIPSDQFKPIILKDWRWRPGKPAMTEAEADEAVQRAASALEPTGNPFLDLCIWKGRFPSTRVRFCSQHLKHEPIFYQVVDPLMEAGETIWSWQGVRAEESAARAKLPEFDDVGGGLFNYRPLLRWTAQEVFDFHRKHGVKWNPLYEQGMGRVGCMPCINCRKDELLEISKRFPEEIARVAEWERIVSMASKRQESSFFPSPDDGRGELMGRNIHAVVDWSKTARGGRQKDLFREFLGGEEMCSSIYGLCE